jgi:hypothetical protein
VCPVDTRKISLVTNQAAVFVRTASIGSLVLFWAKLFFFYANLRIVSVNVLVMFFVYVPLYLQDTRILFCFRFSIVIIRVRFRNFISQSKFCTVSAGK